MSLYMAAGEMKSTSRRLSEFKTPKALEHGQKALEYLLNGQKGLESAAEKLSGQKMNAGKPISGPVQMRSGGMMGFRSAPVKLPSRQ